MRDKGVRQFESTSRSGYPATMVEITKAQTEGAAALMSNQPLSACPYLRDESERGRFLAVMWQRGWRAKQAEARNLP
ncbi:ribosome modulation factor [Prescottella subtropica]|uniref:ribosome modulation factor n=1 Tax=Prescottella subtropica TaxID=2545757 RepID=UPI0010F9C812|nr:Rmf/CrpP family protein [Prescottella subtropica]